MTLNLPFKQINALSLADLGGGAGHVAIQLLPGHRLSWLLQWPHARAWRFSNPEPSLICLKDGKQAADTLALAVTQYASRNSGHARVAQGSHVPDAVPPAIAAAE